MKVEHLKAELDREKKKFNEAKSRVEELRLEIARAICPIGIGERVRYQKNGKEYEGIVEGIHYAVDTTEYIFPEEGAETGWAVYGLRINKTTGKTGKFSFSVSSRSHELQAGVWVPTNSIEKFLDL